MALLMMMTSVELKGQRSRGQTDYSEMKSSKVRVKRLRDERDSYISYIMVQGECSVMDIGQALCLH